jgi:hypothetical protein
MDLHEFIYEWKEFVRQCVAVQQYECAVVCGSMGQCLVVCVSALYV